MRGSEGELFRLWGKRLRVEVEFEVLAVDLNEA